MTIREQPRGCIIYKTFKFIKSFLLIFHINFMFKTTSASEKIFMGGGQTGPVEALGWLTKRFSSIYFDFEFRSTHRNKRNNSGFCDIYAYI